MIVTLLKWSEFIAKVCKY